MPLLIAKKGEPDSRMGERTGKRTNQRFVRIAPNPLKILHNKRSPGHQFDSGSRTKESKQNKWRTGHQSAAKSHSGTHQQSIDDWLMSSRISLSLWHGRPKRRFTIHTAQHSHVNTVEASNVRRVGTRDMSAIQHPAVDHRTHQLKFEPWNASIAPQNSARKWGCLLRGQAWTCATHQNPDSRCPV